MKLSWIIPYMEADPGKPAVLKRCTDSAIGYDELIISSNWKEGYAKPINRGLNLAKGDFLFVSNDDLIFDGGSLKRLCQEDAVTSPIVNGLEQPFWGCAFCIPRWVYEKVGGLFEGYRISYFDDDDYINTLKEAGIQMRSVPSVQVQHPEGGRTLHTFPDNREFFEENKKLYNERWPQYPL